MSASPDGEEEAGEQNEERSAERRVPGAARQAEAVLQNCQGLQRGEKNNEVSACASFVMDELKDKLQLRGFAGYSEKMFKVRLF